MDFNSKKSFTQALLDGRRFKNKWNEIIYFDEKRKSPFRIDSCYNTKQWDQLTNLIEVDKQGKTINTKDKIIYI